MNPVRTLDRHESKIYSFVYHFNIIVYRNSYATSYSLGIVETRFSLLPKVASLCGEGLWPELWQDFDFPLIPNFTFHSDDSTAKDDKENFMTKTVVILKNGFRKSRIHLIELM